MDIEDQLAQLLRLRGIVSRSVPEQEVGATDAYALTESYLRLRTSVRSMTSDLGGDAEAFDLEFPEIDAVSKSSPAPAPRTLFDYKSKASHAAALLRQLAGHVEGLIEAYVIEKELDMDQVQAAREASRQPVGFR